MKTIVLYNLYSKTMAVDRKMSKMFNKNTNCCAQKNFLRVKLKRGSMTMVDVRVYLR